jgi:thiazole synthase
MSMVHDDPLVIAGREFRSRLLVGTGKFPSLASMQAAIDASGAEIVTVALRRVDLDAPSDDLLEHLDRSRMLLLPNTSGARDADEAVRLARLARAAGLGDWLKLEVTPEPRYLLPDPVETLRLEEVGCATVMPLGAPIGSNRGFRTRDAVRIILENARVPVVVDAGLGLPSHAADALECGAHAVLVNTAIAVARDVVAMARAFAGAVEAGRAAWLAGPGGERDAAEASSPLTGFLDP